MGSGTVRLIRRQFSRQKSLSTLLWASTTDSITASGDEGAPQRQPSRRPSRGSAISNEGPSEGRSGYNANSKLIRLQQVLSQRRWAEDDLSQKKQFLEVHAEASFV